MNGRHPPGLTGVLTGDWMYSRAAASLFGVYQNLPGGSKLDFPVGGTYSHAKRNVMAEKVTRHPDWRWFASLDGDMVFPHDIVPRLLEHEDADIIGGLYLLKTPNYTPVAGHVENQPEDAPEGRPSDHPDWQLRTLDLNRVGEEMGAVEVDVLGSGAMVVRRQVFEELESPWFRQNQNNPNALGGNQDYNLCLRAKRAGFTVVCDTRIQCEHIGHRGITVPKARGYWREKVVREKKRRRRAAGIVAG